MLRFYLIFSPLVCHFDADDGQWTYSARLTSEWFMPKTWFGRPSRPSPRRPHWRVGSPTHSWAAARHRRATFPRYDPPSV